MRTQATSSGEGVITEWSLLLKVQEHAQGDLSQNSDLVRMKALSCRVSVPLSSPGF